MLKGRLIAWDPVAQKQAWRVKHDHIWNGGTLATAGGLVFQGLADGWFKAFVREAGPGYRYAFRIDDEIDRWDDVLARQARNPGLDPVDPDARRHLVVEE